MKKKVVLLSIIAAVIVIAGCIGYYFYDQKRIADQFYETMKDDFDSELRVEIRKKIIEKSPNSKFGLYCASWLERVNDSPEKALNKANELVKNYPDWEYSYLSRGRAFYDKEHYEKSIKDFDKALTIKKDFKNALLYIADD